MANDKALKLSQVPILVEKFDGRYDPKYLGKTDQAASAAKLGNEAAVGSATNPVFFTADGVPQATDFTLGKSVPADAVFTDTTYSEATDEAAGLLSSANKAKLDGLGTAASAAKEATLTDGDNLPTGAAVKSFVEGKGYQTATEVNSAIEAKGYQTASDVEGAIGTAIAAVYKPAGTVAASALPTLAAGVLGNVYNVSEAFTTTADFVEGAGSKYPAGTNVVVVDVDETGESPAYKFDVLAGFIDLSGLVEYATDDEVRAAFDAAE